MFNLSSGMPPTAQFAERLSGRKISLVQKAASLLCGRNAVRCSDTVSESVRVS